MPIYSGNVLTGSTSGRPIPIAATASPGTLIHTAASGTTGFDEVFLFGSNVTSLNATITIEWGGTGNPADHLVTELAIPARSVGYPLSVGQRIQNGLSIRAFSGTASAINIIGWYNRSS